MLLVQVVALDIAWKNGTSNFGPFLKGHISGNIIDKTREIFCGHSHQLRDAKEYTYVMQWYFLPNQGSHKNLTTEFKDFSRIF